ncbi:uncharacterized protein LOC134813516 [Bolinopsis microptera]|uniref:uncharacterized protein LOC134813516 n=1 Tax=Bolinopsis microptera TaxID=2820187 RepID=UPI00307AA1F6
MYEFSSSVDLIMIGRKDCTKDQLVLEKLKTMKVDDIFDIPNVFQTITRAEEPSSTAWRSLMSHPFTPSYIRLNLPAYIQAVKVMVVHHSEDLKFVRESLQYLYKRVVYEKNKKRVYVSVVENILPYLLEKHNDPDARAVLDDIVLNKEALSLLEAYLTAKMSNFTSVLVQQSKSLELAQTCTLFEILCSGKKSKKSNKMLLRWFTEVCDLDVLKNVALLGVIRKYRIYQIEEDREQGYEVSAHFTSLLSSLVGEEYCSVAIAILPLNYSVVTLEQALLHCNDLLLAELALTYHKTGKLLLLFQQIVLRFNPRVSLGKEFRSQLSEASNKLSEQQLLALLTLLSSTLEENLSVSNSEPTDLGSYEITESRDTSKRPRVSDERLCGFIADCTSVLISQCRVHIPDDVVIKLYNITKNLPPSTGKTLRLFFNSAVLFDKISSFHPFEVSETPPSNEEEVQLLIKSLHYSDNPTDKLDTILSTISTYPDVILSNFLIIYNNMITDHLMTVAEFLLSTIREHSWFIESEVFNRCTDLHSAIISCVMRDMGAIEEKYYSEPLVDITLSSARDVIKSELSLSGPGVPLENHVDLLYLLSQLSLNSSYHRLLITTWILFRQMSLNKDKLDIGCLLSGGVVSYLGRFCKPPPPHTPLPVVHGKLAGQILSEILSFSAGGTSEFIEIYLGVGVSMSSADLSAVVEYLGTHQVQHSDVIGCLLRRCVSTKHQLPDIMKTY